MVGCFIFVLIISAITPSGFFNPKQLDDLTLNLNLNDSPKGGYLSHNSYEYGDEKDESVEFVVRYRVHIANSLDRDVTGVVYLKEQTRIDYKVGAGDSYESRLIADDTIAIISAYYTDTKTGRTVNCNRFKSKHDYIAEYWNIVWLQQTPNVCEVKPANRYRVHIFNNLNDAVTGRIWYLEEQTKKSIDYTVREYENYESGLLDDAAIEIVRAYYTDEDECKPFNSFGTLVNYYKIVRLPPGGPDVCQVKPVQHYRVHIQNQLDVDVTGEVFLEGTSPTPFARIDFKKLGPGKEFESKLITDDGVVGIRAHYIAAKRVNCKPFEAKEGIIIEKWKIVWIKNPQPYVCEVQQNH